MISRRFSKSRSDEVAVRQFTFSQPLTAGQYARAFLGQLLALELVVFQLAAGGNRPEPVVLQSRIADIKCGNLFRYFFVKRISHLLLYVNSFSRRAFLPA